MTIEINNQTTIRDFQQEFQKVYPFLQVRFSDKPHGFGEEIVGCHWFDPSFRLSFVCKSFAPALVSIHPWIRTGDFEEELKENFGLNAQVYRKDGDQWIQTAGSDYFTLDEQNEIGIRHWQEGTGYGWIERTCLL